MQNRVILPLLFHQQKTYAFNLGTVIFVTLKTCWRIVTVVTHYSGTQSFGDKLSYVQTCTFVRAIRSRLIKIIILTVCIATKINSNYTCLKE